MPKTNVRKKGDPDLGELIRLADEAGLEVFHTPDKDAYAIMPVDGHRETWSIQSKRFRLWLIGLYYGEKDRPPSGGEIATAQSTLTARAIFEGDEQEVHTRVAGHRGKIYLDLCNDAWEAAEISRTGWRVVADPPVRFRRGRAMRVLPTPVPGGSIQDLRPLVNVPDEESFVLLVSYLLAALRPRGPYPLLGLAGEQGSSKSTIMRMVRSLIDPSEAALRTFARSERDLLISAQYGWILAFDNLSGLSDWGSDALCRLSTGGGLATRELYTDSEEVIFSAMRPVMVNGIGEVVRREDLIDRGIFLLLEPLLDKDRRTEAELWAEFEAARPGVLGALLDAVSCALRRLPQVQIDRSPRMADFVHWIVAAEPALPWPDGAFLWAYEDNRRAAVETALAADEVAVAVRDLMGRMSEVEDTPSDILDLFNEFTGEEIKRRQGWPKSASAMSTRLKRLAPALRRSGINVRFTRTADRREIRIAQIEAEPRHRRHARHRDPDDGDSQDTTPPAVTGDDEDGTGAEALENGVYDAHDDDDADLPTYAPERLSDEEEVVV